MRSIEHLLACHKMASELQKAGKPIWKATVKIKHLLPEGCDQMPNDLTPEQAADLGRQIAAVLKSRERIERQKWLDERSENYDEELADIVASLENITGVEDIDMSAEEELLETMSRMYDWADINRIWLD